MLAPASLRAVHPLGNSPVVTDGELVLAEFGAIIEYLVERLGNGQLSPALGTAERLRSRYWLRSYALAKDQGLSLIQVLP
jgi:glutathione S-transferase